MTARAQVLLAVVSLGLLVATAASSSESPSLALYVLLPVIFVFSAASALLERSVSKAAVDEGAGALLNLVGRGLGLSKACSVLIAAPAVSMSVLLFVRLLSQDHFVTDPAALDFGPKNGDPTFQNPNVAFEPEFNSFGHWIQGVLASLLAYPSVSGTLSRLCRKPPPLLLAEPRIWFLVLAEFAAYCFTLYPSYNFVKRTMKSADTFATSSYMNNGTEWAMGCITGISLGMFVSSWTKKKLMNLMKETNQASEGSSATEAYPYGKRDDFPDPPPGLFARVCLGVARLLGIFFFVSVFGACAMTGYTWNKCPDGAQDCVNYSPEQVPVGIITGLLLIPTLICGGTILYQLRMARSNA